MIIKPNELVSHFQNYTQPNIAYYSQWFSYTHSPYTVSRTKRQTREVL